MTPPPAADLPADLPAGLTSRALHHDDVASVVELIHAQEVADTGRAETEEADLVAEWRRPGFDLSVRTVGVHDRGRLVGYAELSHRERGEAAVHPAWRGRGIGTWLARWSQEAARSQGDRRVGMPVLAGSPGDELLESLGYDALWTSWILRLEPDAPLAPVEPPSGVDLRAAEPFEHRLVHRVVDAAFGEWSGRPPTTFEEFAAVTVERPGFEPWHLRVAVDAAGEVVGAAHVSLYDGWEDHPAEGVVHRLAVRADQRGRGLGRAVLLDALHAARARGAVTSSLNTDTRTGAVTLYLSAGMSIASTWVHRSIDLC